MANRRTFQKHLSKKASREATKIARGVVREGGKIAKGFVKGLFRALNPFR